MFIAHLASLQLDEEDFKEEQNSVARLIHMLYNDDPDEMLKVISSSWLPPDTPPKKKGKK